MMRRHTLSLSLSLLATPLAHSASAASRAGPATPRSTPRLGISHRRILRSSSHVTSTTRCAGSAGSTCSRKGGLQGWIASRFGRCTVFSEIPYGHGRVRSSHRRARVRDTRLNHAQKPTELSPKRASAGSLPPTGSAGPRTSPESTRSQPCAPLVLPDTLNTCADCCAPGNLEEEDLLGIIRLFCSRI